MPTIPRAARRLTGHVDDLGPISLLAEASLGSAPGSAADAASRTTVPVRAWGSGRAGDSHLNVADLVSKRREAVAASAWRAAFEPTWPPRYVCAASRPTRPLRHVRV